ncbi:condensation domain-containing protein [Escherichia coli]
MAHYVELTGDVDAPLLARAVVVGLAQADTLRMRFTEDNGEVWQWVDDALIFELPEIIDLRTILIARYCAGINSGICNKICASIAVNHWSFIS